MTLKLEESWKHALSEEFSKPYWPVLTESIRNEYAEHVCFPAGNNIFRAFDSTPFSDVKVVILGQDPYHTPGAAMGLSFSVPETSKKSQPSLQNIFKELEGDLGIKRTKTDLSDWAAQGVLLLNSVLTVRSGEAASHKGKGWELFTDAVIQKISQERDSVVFILWGNYAIAKGQHIDKNRHCVLTSPHPSPFSAYSGFFGSKPFSQTNAYLVKQNKTPIVW